MYRIDHTGCVDGVSTVLLMNEYLNVLSLVQVTSIKDM